MFNRKKKVTLDDIRVVSKSIPTPSTDTTLPLTIRNLPYDPDRKPEETELVKKYVINKSDPFWYRPRPVTLRKDSYILINKYLRDQQREKQYTVGEMEDVLGIDRSDTKLENRMGWLYDVFNTWSTKLKVLKPFELKYSQIVAAITPTSNVLNDIAVMLGAKNVEYPTREASLKLVNNASTEVISQNKARKTRRLIKLYQSCLDVLRLDGSYENCYIHIMKQGDDQERDECVIVKPKKIAIEIQHPGMEPRIVNDVKCMSFWERQQKRKLDQKIREENLKNKSLFNWDGLQSRVPPEAVIKRKIYNLSYSDSSSDDDNDSTDCIVDALPIEQNADHSTSQQDERKRKKKGVMRKLKAPFRWLKKKL